MKAELELRLARVQDELRRKKLHGLVIDGRESSLYLSGFPCSASLVLVTRKGAWFFTDSRYSHQASATIDHMEVVLSTQRALTQIADVIKAQRLRRLGFEEFTSYAQYQALLKAFQDVELVPAGSIIRDLRLIKSQAEIKIIAANQRLNQKIWKAALAAVKQGQTEIEVRNHIIRLMLESGCEEAFATILAAGPNSANPHAVPGNRRIKRGELLLFDMGVKKSHYHSDMTRTVAIGDKLNPQCAEIYEVVREAQAAALKQLGPGVPCKQVDAAARDIIASAGYAEQFGHGLGHGVGLEIHEGPTLNPRSEDILKPGMVVTVEPGIYLPGIGGVRIEDLVVITENGYQNLTSVSKQLLYVS